MNHSYRIVTEEVHNHSSGRRYFVARLTNVMLEVNGERIKAPYPNEPYKGKTYESAMLKANDAFVAWLDEFEPRAQMMEM